MYNYILDLLPYKSTFRFVDEIAYVDADKVIGHYTLRPDAFFYNDHFPGNPVTPGAILTEIMAQIGLVVLGIYLIIEGKAPAPDAAAAGASAAVHGNTAAGAAPTGTPTGGAGASIFPLLSSANVEFFKMALPGQQLTVTSKKEYFRFDKLKCQVEMHDAAGERVAKGVFSGFLKYATV
jgi:3-hydroxyacyl-[acyl-carrier-protein] dehydratase